jgi:hypothetical protein
MDSSALERLERVVNELVRTVTELKVGERHTDSNHLPEAGEYLSVKQLAQLIPYRGRPSAI